MFADKVLWGMICGSNTVFIGYISLIAYDVFCVTASLHMLNYVVDDVLV